MYKKILVPVDLGREKNAIKLCNAAADMAGEDSEIRLISIAPGYGMPVVASFFPADAQEKVLAELLSLLTKLAEANLSGEVSVRVREGKRSKTILAEADNWSADLIVVGSRKKLSRDGQRVLGSCSSSVADRAKCNVMIVRGLPLK
ncbi:MAG: universal stress protein [Proteobacteria bacterium]|nr:universal stress protein [Pseudomonadota bacterium]